MANLLGQNIGTNYKGILNLNTLNGNLSGTLQAVTDGDGNASPLQLSTTQVGITGAVQTGTGALYNPLRAGYSNSTIGVTNLELFSFGGIANSSSRYSAVLRLGGGSDTSQHYIYGGEGNSTGIVLDRGDAKVGVIGVFETRRDTTNYYRSVNNAASAFVDLQFDVRNAYYQFNAGTGMGLGITSGIGARLHVRGDGTNPILRSENIDGSQFFRHNIIGDDNRLFLGRTADLTVSGDITYNNSSGTLTIRNNYAPAPNFGFVDIIHGATTARFQNGTTPFNLLISASSVFSVSSAGALTTGSSITSGLNMTVAAGGAYIISTRGFLGAASDGVWTLYDSSASSFNRLQFGGNTNAFPALKRNAAALEVRLADDSGFANLTANDVFVGSQFRNIGLSAATALRYANDEIRASITGNNGVFKIYNPAVDVNVFWMEANGSLSINKGSAAAASAVLEVNSTTKGFLLPRQTEAQRLNISSPAVGLMVYQTDATDGLYVYKTGGWQFIA